MLKLIKNMRRKEKEMALLCLVFVVVQIYFDLRLPDYMTELTMLIKTSGTTGGHCRRRSQNARLHGGKRGACDRVRLSRRENRVGIQLCGARKALPPVMDIGSEEMRTFPFRALSPARRTTSPKFR